MKCNFLKSHSHVVYLSNATVTSQWHGWERERQRERERDREREREALGAVKDHQTIETAQEDIVHLRMHWIKNTNECKLVTRTRVVTCRRESNPGPLNQFLFWYLRPLSQCIYVTDLPHQAKLNTNPWKLFNGQKVTAFELNPAPHGQELTVLTIVPSQHLWSLTHKTIAWRLKQYNHTKRGKGCSATSNLTKPIPNCEVGIKFWEWD